MVFTLHAEALAWLRYGKRLPFVCTEAGPWNADVMGMDQDHCVEVEIKKSRADLLAEFRNKGPKHYLYQNAFPAGQALVPNFFYFFVPYELGDSTVELVNEKAPKAGVASVMHPGRTPYGVGKGVVVLKRATRLHAGKPSMRFMKAVQMRMGSEICSLRLAFENLKKLELTELLIHEAILLAKAATDTTDIEADYAAAIEASAGREHPGSVHGDLDRGALSRSGDAVSDGPEPDAASPG